jgi:histone H2A
MAAKSSTTSKVKSAQLPAEDTRAKPQRLEHKANLVFPVGRLMRHMRQRGVADRVSTRSAVAVAATLEYLCAEVLEMAGDSVRAEATGQRLKPRHIRIALRNDQELSLVLSRTAVICLQD